MPLSKINFCGLVLSKDKNTEAFLSKISKNSKLASETRDAFSEINNRLGKNNNWMCEFYEKSFDSPKQDSLTCEIVDLDKKDYNRTTISIFANNNLDEDENAYLRLLDAIKMQVNLYSKPNKN